MPEFLSFFIILVAGLLFSEVFQRLHLPWVVALIVAGVFLGPSGFGVFEPTATIQVIGNIGLVFLMFMAGLETRLSDLKHMRREVSIMSFLGAVIPFLVGGGIGLMFGYSITISLLIGIVFISSSIAVVIPVLESAGLMHTKLSTSIVASTMIQDVASLILVSVFFQSTNPTTSLPLWLFYTLLVVFLVVFRFAVPRIETYLKSHLVHEQDIFQRELQIVFAILLGTVVVFEFLGLHPIVAGFFAGLVLSDSITSETLKSKLRVLSYGLFIPTFFIIVGVETNIRALGNVGLFAGVLVAGSMLAKLLSGWLGARAVGFPRNAARVVAFAGVPQLSTTLAVVFLAYQNGLFDEPLVAAMVALSVVTTFVAPIGMRWAMKKVAPATHV